MGSELTGSRSLHACRFSLRKGGREQGADRGPGRVRSCRSTELTMD